MSGTDATATPRRSAPGSLSTGPSPTRNAQPRGKARSVASKSPDPSITDGESEYGEDDSKIGMEDSIDADVAGHDGDDGDYGDNGDDGDDEEEDEDEDYGNRGEEDDAAVSEAREIQYEVMTRLLPDLQKATRDLKQHIDNGDDGNGVFAVISKAKRGAFRFYTQAMNYPASQSNFIDFLLLEKSADRREPETTSIITASLAANLVHAIDCIRQILNDDPVDMLSFLKDLDVAFPQLLATTSDFSSLSSLALNIRTQVFIQTLAAQPGEPDVAAAIASVFCAGDDDNKDYSSHDISPNDIAGPFKSLCDIKEIGKEIQEIVPRIEQLAAVICKDKDNQGVRRLEEEYSLNALLEDVYTWCLEQYRLVKEAEGHSDASEEDVFRDALGSLPSVLDSPVKVPIERRSPGVHQKEPRVRPQREPPLDASSDCSIATRMLLERDSGTSLLTTGKRRLGQGVDGDRDDYQEYYHDDHDGGHDDDQRSETDDFEIDARQNHDPDAVRATIKASNPFPPSKRQALPSQPPASSSMPSSSMPHRATLPHGGTSIPASDRPNLGNVRAMRERNLHHARAQDLAPNPTSRRRLATASPPPSLPHFPATTRQRNPWSDDDSTLLVKLIAEERAKWSVIDRKHGHRFEIARNQQAYRDRARNMKVDFLLADAVLPSGFDLVVLGKKEELKVVAGRRNAHRKENDRDENGRPINTRI